MQKAMEQVPFLKFSPRAKMPGLSQDPQGLLEGRGESVLFLAMGLEERSVCTGHTSGPASTASQPRATIRNLLENVEGKSPKAWPSAENQKSKLHIRSLLISPSK